MTETRSATLIGPLFPNVKQLDNTPKARRLQLFLTHYHRPKCNRCAEKAHYLTVSPENDGRYRPSRRAGIYWCKAHLPDTLKRRLTAEWQMRNIILPLARYLS